MSIIYIVKLEGWKPEEDCIGVIINITTGPSCRFGRQDRFGGRGLYTTTIHTHTDTISLLYI